MPALHAHYHFGGEVIEVLPQALKETVNKYRELFDIGVQGPDIFFYCGPLSTNPINNFGSQLHHQPVKNFYSKIKDIYQIHPDRHDPLIAYLSGFNAHFTLDLLCHPYIEKKIRISQVSHYAIESEYDRYLMAKDHCPKGCCRSLVASPFNAEVIKLCYPEWDIKTIKKAIKGIRFYNQLLLANKPLKRVTLSTLMKMIPVKDLADHLITEIPNPLCADSDLRLDKLKAVALKLYPELLHNLLTYFNDQSPLHPLFEYSFDEKMHIEDIPVLSLSKERAYEIENDRPGKEMGLV